MQLAGSPVQDDMCGCACMAVLKHMLCATVAGWPAGLMRPMWVGCCVQGEEAVQLELLKTDSYDDVSKAIAAKLGLDDPLKLRLTGALVGQMHGEDGQHASGMPPAFEPSLSAYAGAHSSLLPTCPCRPEPPHAAAAAPPHSLPPV